MLLHFEAGFVLELGAGEVAPVIAAPTIRIRDLDRPGPAEFGHRLKIRLGALFVGVQFSLEHIASVAERGCRKGEPQYRK